MERWPTTRVGKMAAALLCVGLVVWLGSRMHRKTLKPRSDYQGFVSGARAVLAGEDVVSAHAGSAEEAGRPFWYPAWFAMAMVPFALMGPGASSAAWPLLNLAALGASSYWCLRVARGPDTPVPWPLCVVPALLVARALDSNFGLAQLNMLVLAPISLGLYCHMRGRRVAAGLALGAAAALKVTPGLLVAYFAWKREWRVVAGSIAAVAVLALVVPAPVYGLRGSWDSTRRWLDAHVFGRTDAVDEDGYVPGQSIRAMAYRLLTDSQAAAHTDRQVRVHIASLSEGTAEAIYRAAGAVLLVALAIVCFGPAARQGAGRTAAELSLVLLAMLLLSPYSRKAHFVLLMFPMTFAYSRLALTPSWSRGERVLLAGLLLALPLTTATARGLIGEHASLWLTAVGCMGWGTLALFLAILAYVGRPPLGGPAAPPAGSGGM